MTDKGEKMDRIGEVKKILNPDCEIPEDCNLTRTINSGIKCACCSRKAKEIDALYSTVDGELREKIAHILSDDFCKEITTSDPFDLSKVCEGDCIPCRLDAIEPLLHPYLKQMIAKAGYVKLSKNQELPPIPSFTYDKQADIPLLKRGAINYSKLLSGWRKTDES